MINEQKLAERFSRDVDKLIKNPSAEITPAGPAPEEYKRRIELARFMVTAVLAERNIPREGLRQCLINRVANRAKHRAGRAGKCELDDEQLGLVAAGTGRGANNDQQAAFVCGRGASTITGDICPDCGQLRSLHRGGGANHSW